LLRRADQAVVAGLVALSLAAMAAYFVVQGGFRGGLIEIDRATPLEARFRVDINQAQWSELSQLPEVGETLARRIVDWRAANGPFKDNNELRRVRGIGPRTLERINPYLLPLPGQEEVAGSPSTATRTIP
jgi:competence protein ComEA